MAQNDSNSIAVLTGDIVNSTGIGTRSTAKLIAALGELFGARNHEFYRGDSFQVLETDPAQALKLAMQCRSLALRLPAKTSSKRADIRISIGLGKTGPVTGKPGISGGEAFLLSGRSFDAISSGNKKLSVTAGPPLAAAALAVVADYADSIFRSLTPKQADLYHYLLAGNSQQQAAKFLQKSKSTVHQYAVSGRWHETEQLLLHYQTIIKLLP